MIVFAVATTALTPSHNPSNVSRSVRSPRQTSTPGPRRSSTSDRGLARTRTDTPVSRASRKTRDPSSPVAPMISSMLRTLSLGPAPAPEGGTPAFSRPEFQGVFPQVEPTGLGEGSGDKKGSPVMTTSVARSFREAVSGSTAEDLEQYLSAATAVEKVLAGKVRRAEYLARRADSVLDVGCGSGDALAALASTGGFTRIAGTDLNADLLAVAGDRLGPVVELVEADATALPFADDEFGAVLIERMLQHVTDPAAVVREAVRVVEPGGAVLVVEPDWTTLGVASGDPSVTAIVLAAVRDQIRHPGVGRELRRLLVDAGATDVIIDAEVHETDDLAVARFLALIDDALTVVRAEKIVAEPDLTTWEEQLGADASAGRFSASLVLFVACGTVR